ncbi:hypothetical protein OY671_010825 [Metschnikowia pulcherrima]|nr:hypothetical protein OY671_010825 [Metschnikowia pulcherrima]
MDSETTRSSSQTSRDINRELGVTIVLVTHESAVVYQSCSHVAVLEHGRSIEQFAIDAPAESRRSALGRELAEPVAERQWREAPGAAAAAVVPIRSPGIVAPLAPSYAHTPKVSYA